MFDTTQFCGVHTALISPMRDGDVQFSELERLVDSQIRRGINGLVAVGTTGESPTLDHAEHKKVIEVAADTAAKRVPLLAGTGSNSTREAVSLTRDACALDNVAGALVVAPYYNKPSQEGLFRHFKTVAQATEKPVVLYSIPGRCGVAIGVETVSRLHKTCPNVIGIKEAGGNVERVAALRSELGDDFLILSGDDGLTLPFMTFGARGVISVASNLVVEPLVEMVRLALEDRFAEAREIEQQHHALFNALFIEPNPVPIKTAMAAVGAIRSPDVRLPLCEMSEANRQRLFNVMANLGLQVPTS